MKTVLIDGKPYVEVNYTTAGGFKLPNGATHADEMLEAALTRNLEMKYGLKYVLADDASVSLRVPKIIYDTWHASEEAYLVFQNTVFEEFKKVPGILHVTLEMSQLICKYQDRLAEKKIPLSKPMQKHIIDQFHELYTTILKTFNIESYMEWEEDVDENNSVGY